jgi:hypothetical protein
MEEQASRYQKRHEAAMDRMEKKHAREVQIEVDKDRVTLEGELRSATRTIRQCEAELQKVQEERSDLRDELHIVTTDNSEMFKVMGRERRHNDVAKQTLLDKCANLEVLVRRKEKQEEGRKRQHMEAMGKADALLATFEAQKTALAKEEGQWRWKCAKKERQLGLDEDAVKVAKFGVDYARTRLERKEVSMGKRDDTLAVKERAADKVRAKVHAERQVSLLLSLNFLFPLFPCLECMPFALYWPQTIRKRAAKVVALRKVWNLLSFSTEGRKDREVHAGGMVGRQSGEQSCEEAQSCRTLRTKR